MADKTIRTMRVEMLGVLVDVEVTEEFKDNTWTRTMEWTSPAMSVSIGSDGQPLVAVWQPELKPLPESARVSGCHGY